MADCLLPIDPAFPIRPKRVNCCTELLASRPARCYKRGHIIAFRFHQTVLDLENKGSQARMSRLQLKHRHANGSISSIRRERIVQGNILLIDPSMKACCFEHRDHRPEAPTSRFPLLHQSSWRSSRILTARTIRIPLLIYRQADSFATQARKVQYPQHGQRPGARRTDQA